MLIFFLSACSAPKAQDQSQEAPNDAQNTAEQGSENDVLLILELGKYYGPLQVVGPHLTNSEGKPVQLRGVSSHGLAWYPEYVNFEMMKQMKEDWGANVFRLALYTEDSGGYCSGDDANREVLLAKIDEAVRAAHALEMYIIIDWHTLNDSSPLIYADEAKTFFERVAQKYQGFDHVIYEICNEPNGDTTWGDVKTYAESVIPIIRQYSDAVILVGTPEYSTRVDQVAADPLEGFNNIMYTLHFYAGNNTGGLKDTMVELSQSRLPLFVSEFGICDASGDGKIDEDEADRWLESMNEAGISYILWNLSNKDESAAMILASCPDVSNIAYEDLSRSGKWFVDYGHTLKEHS